MSTLAAVKAAGSLASYRLGVESYDQDKLGLGPLMVQQSGSGDANFAGPVPIAVIRPMEAATPIPLTFPWAIQWQNTASAQLDWIFLADVSSAAATRRLGMATFNRLTGVFSYLGFLTVTFPGTSEAKTIRWLRGSYVKLTAGTVAVSGTAVTGTSTLYQTNGACAGNRIGFGSADPTAITTWYEIASVDSETGITLTGSAGTIAGGTAYVIEDLRLVLGVTSLTTSLGGVYLVEGLRMEQFTSAGGTVPAANATDKIRQCVFLKDAATGTALATFGAADQSITNNQTHYLWQIHTIANPILQKYNIRAALTISSGSTTSALVLITGAGGALTGTPSQLNNARYAVCGHGPGSGVGCIYFTTTTRVYRTDNVASIAAASTTWMIDSMLEIPPGSANTYPGTGALSSIEYSGSIDRFILMSSGAAGGRSYVTRYLTDGSQYDRLAFLDTKQTDQSTADATSTPHPSINVSSLNVWVEGGLLYASRFGTTAILNQVWAVPIGADWEYAATTGCRVVFPSMTLVNAATFIRAFVNASQVIGGATGKNLGMTPGAVRLYYRSAGISDNSGAWTLLSQNGDMSGVSGTAAIQFMCEYRIDGAMIPGRVHSVGVTYTDTGSTPSSYWQESVGKSSVANAQFAWRFKTAYGTTIPRLRIRLYNAITGALLDDDDTTTLAGTWQKSTDGTTWGAWSTTDKGNETTYLRWTPAAVSSVTVRPLLTEY